MIGNTKMPRDQLIWNGVKQVPKTFDKEDMNVDDSSNSLIGYIIVAVAVIIGFFILGIFLRKRK